MMIKTKLLGAAAVLLLSAGAAAAAPAVVALGPQRAFRAGNRIRRGRRDPGRRDRRCRRLHGGWCQVVSTGGTGYANRSYLQIAAGAPSAGVVVQAPAYDPYDYDYDYGYSYGPGVSFYAGPRFRHRHDGWRQGWHGRSAGTWQGRSWQGRSWQGGDRQGARMGPGMARGAPQPGGAGRGGGGGRAARR